MVSRFLAKQRYKKVSGLTSVAHQKIRDSHFLKNNKKIVHL